MDFELNDVNNTGIPPVTDPSLLEGNNDTSSTDVKKNEVDIQNKLAEAERKLSAMTDRVSFMEDFIKQRNMNNQEQPKRSAEDDYYLDLSDSKIQEWEDSGQPQLIIEANKAKAIKAKTSQVDTQQAISVQANKIRMEIKNELQFDEYKNKAVSEFPEIKDNSTPQYQAVNKELHDLMTGGYSGPDRIYRACLMAKAKAPQLFTKNTRVDNRERMLGEHLNNTYPVANGAGSKSLTNSERELCKEFGISPEKFMERKTALLKSKGRI